MTRASRPVLVRGTSRSARAARGVAGVAAVLLAAVLLAAVVLALAACAAQAPSPPRVTVTASPGATPAQPSAPQTPTGASAPGEVIDVDAEVIDHAQGSYAVVTLPLERWDVRVGWDPQAGGVMLADVIAEDPTVAVATNAGIFTPEMVPGGLLVSDGDELVPLNLADGGGNFHLKPNAVFAVHDDGTATVVDSVDYEPEGVAQATQSGPALVLDGEVHPEFREGSTNLALRNGVGVSPDGSTVYLAMSVGLTNLWDFATLFRDELGVEDALYLDGQVSDLWVSGMGEPGALSGPYAGVITAHER
ncbi:phosphodiester glycosidase family protein [Demequina sp. NBRC 110053]|uniref:phosphodiester glycosidase family protein n=1 Tax=Demequina sp. NBRC 110053 TaxID=1570342 RepID=UPI00118545BA|nr:phosphodiester glycosidase family protein [Demequina sp. NBRC 110053]